MSVDLARIVDSIHRDKNIAKEILFEGIESALATAAKKHFPDAEDIQVSIDRETGKNEIDTSFHITFFGSTASGKRVQSDTASGILLFNYSATAPARMAK